MNFHEEPKPPFRGRREGSLAKLALALLVMAALAFVVDVFQVPNPNMVLITGLVVFTALYGFPAGILCAAVMVAYSLYFFSTDHSFVRFNALNTRKMATILLSVILNTLIVGKLKQSEDAAVKRLLAANENIKGRLQRTYLGRRLARRMPTGEELLDYTDNLRERTPEGVRMMADMVLAYNESNK